LNKFIIPCILLLIASTVLAQTVTEPTPGLADIGIQGTDGTNTVRQENLNKTIRELDKAISTNPNDAVAWNNKGATLYNLKKYEEALLACDKAIELDPKYAIAWSNKGNTLYNLKKYEEALLAYDKAIELDPNDAKAWNNKGYILYNLKKYEEALQAYGKAIELDPKEAIAWSNKGNTLYNLKKYEEALQAYDKAIELDPKYAKAWNNKGYILYNLKKYEEALQAYGKAIELDPKNAIVWSNKGYVLDNLKKYEEALQAYDKAIELDPKDIIVWSNKGITLNNLKRYKEALKACDKAMEQDPKEAIVWNNKGNVLNNLKRYKEAIQAYVKAINLDPDYVLAYNDLGDLFYQLGNIEGALHNAELALTKQKEYAPSLHLKGKALIEKKDYGAACRCFQDAIVSDKGNLSYIIWDAYADFLKLEFSSELNQPDKKEKYKEELSLIIRKLERANELSSGNENKKEIKACILYFLAGFYLKNKDVFAAKEKLVECISLKAETPIDKSARDMLGIVWNYHIKPPFWVWWCNSPLYKWHKRIGFTFIVFALAGLLIYPLFFSQKFPENRVPYLILIGLLIAILFMPNLERIKTQEMEIQLRPPPTLESALSPILMEGQLRMMESNAK